ncbi:MAG: DUF2306 domain-containing protein [Archangium sp.]|nr:DUF2306 domain-containing protein [Archangium sp.]
MASPSRADWLIPASLIALAFIPVVAGTHRLVMLAGDGPITPENTRFFAAPLPVVLHIVSVAIYCLVGAFQFHPGFRRRSPAWHRRAGWVLVGAGLGSGLTGIWMAMTYAIVPADSALLHAFRLFFGVAMVVSIVLAVVAIRQRNLVGHQAWMGRAYAIGQGAGTQAVTQGFMFVLFGPPDELRLALMMGGAWVLNLAVAEWLLRRRPAPARQAAVA